jgi:SET domain
MDSSSSVVYTDLVQWITQPSHGGIIHEHIKLRGQGSNRGLFTSRRILQGELLVSIPASLVLSGATFPNSYGNPSISVSSWLRCVACYYDACRMPSEVFFRPYLNSLPTSYESSLLLWTDMEISHYLGGTHLGDRVLHDRANHALKIRYEEAVQPYLNHLGLLSSSESNPDALTEFRQACLCIATRGFHVSLSSISDSYDGPYLIPFIDLFNHDSKTKCTTLVFRNGCFQMKAERDIEVEEELFHSYSDNLTSAQFLQTFGFIPETHFDDVERGSLIDNHVSPAVFTQLDVISACSFVIRSSFPDTVRDYMKSTSELVDDQSWTLNHNILLRELSFLPDIFEVSKKVPLSENLITAFCVLLFPSDVYHEFVSSSPSLLTKDILEDYFLGKLVCQAIQVAVESKSASYSKIEPFDVSVSNQDDDRSLFRQIRARSDLKRLSYGLAIRIEEKSCLLLLKEEIRFISDTLGGVTLIDTLMQEPFCKKSRIK